MGSYLMSFLMLALRCRGEWSAAHFQPIYALGKDVPEYIELGFGMPPDPVLLWARERSLAGAGNLTMICGLSGR
jgi:hypothetical protein